jgi:hypothetical protein
MSQKLLANAIGKICARQSGLYKLVLPRSLPVSFKGDVAKAVKADGGVAVPIGDAEGEYSPGEAIAFRTPEDGDGNKAIVLVASEGQARDLKSLETFRDALSGGMPGGLDETTAAIIGVEALALEISSLASKVSGASLDHVKLRDALRGVISFLGSAYREAGNDEKRWTDAFWLHLDLLVERLPVALSKLPAGAPGFARDAVYAAAGLPRPGGAEHFAGKNSPQVYAKIVARDWVSQEDIERSLVAIDILDGNGAGTHPLMSIDWGTIASSRAVLGHPLLAVAFHGSEGSAGLEWLHGWASTSERAFFEDRDKEEPGYELYALDAEGNRLKLDELGWQGLDHILPPGPATLRDDGRISLGQLEIRLDVDLGEEAKAVPVALDVKPATAATPEVSSWRAENGTVQVTFELSRRAAKSGGKWREKPFTLSISPSSIKPGSRFVNSLNLKLCAPHPSRPTGIALEERRGAAKPVATFATDGRFQLNNDTGTIALDRANEEPALLKLRDGSARISLAVVRAESKPTWVGGAALSRLDQGSDKQPFEFFALSPLPDHSVIDLDGYPLNVAVPEIEKGQVNPVFAAITGEPVVPVDDGLRNELLTDPRGWLEQWYAETCIANQPAREIEASLGSCVLEVSGRGNTSLSFSEGIGAYTNTSAAVHLEFPAGLMGSDSAREFWRAFSDLQLAHHGGVPEVSTWPSALDLRDLPGEKIEAYLAAFSSLLDTIGEPRAHSWLAYPFSAMLYNQQKGEPEGVLLSPLHPLRLAWSWSVQKAGDELARNEVFGSVASSFLRFVDAELLPLTGPTTRGSERWIGAGLAPGPNEFFSGWSLLAGAALRENHSGKSISLLGLELPFGTPSGLDQGGVSAALRDYMRIYPASPQLRIGLAAPSGGERYAETDEAIIAASGDLLARHGDDLPGGVRIFDSSNRRGSLPSAVRVLQKILPEAVHARDPSGHAPFEWTTDPERGPASNVDLQFIEDTVVRIRAEEIIGDEESVGTSGPSLPFSRFRSWRTDEIANDVSSFALGIEAESFQELPSFGPTLGKVECLKASGSGIKLASELRLGDDLLGAHARWTITGNRHLDPSVLSAQLRRAPGDIALWEWRPAFLTRDKQKDLAGSIASTHPYTVLARPSGALSEEVANVLETCGMGHSPSDVRDVITSLGMRGVGLSSLLTMGHSQSLGAIGFSLAFRSLDTWERQARTNEIRCVVPMDAVYPLLDVLGEGARAVDDQRRADLLLLSAQLEEGGQCSLRLHPVEVKMRSGERASFPGRSAKQLSDPMEQLDATRRVLEQVGKNLGAVGSNLSLVNAALATLAEAALSLRPERPGGQVPLETAILSRVAAGKVSLKTSAGTLLWFQVNAVGAGGGMYERRSGNQGEPGQFFANPACFDAPGTLKEVGKIVAEIVEQGDELARKGSNNLVGAKTGEKDRPTYDYVVKEKAPSKDEIGKNDADLQPENGEKHEKDIEAEQQSGGKLEDELRSDEQVVAPPGIEVLVGHQPTGASFEPVYFKPSETALNQLNIGVVGDLGTGKTQFLKSLVYQLSQSAESNRGHAPKVFIFDYKRDYSEGDFPDALGAKILDPSKNPLPINFFALGVDPEDRVAVQRERVRRANFFGDLLRRISGIGPVQRNDLYSSVMEAYKACAKGHAPSIDDVFDVYAALGKNDSVVSVLTLLRDLMIFESEPENTTTFEDLFDRSTVLNLSGLSGAGQDIVDIVATMFLDNLYTDYMKTLPKEPFIDGPDGINRRKVDSFVLIDEAHHAMARDFDVLMKLMLEGREFGMGVVLSSQFLSHFDAGKHDWAEALSTWVVHNVRNTSAKQFERIGFRHDVSRMVQEVTGLETHWAYYRCVNGHNEGILMKGQPFYSLPKR